MFYKTDYSNESKPNELRARESNVPWSSERMSIKHVRFKSLKPCSKGFYFGSF